jgi:HK97 family phage portal protein
VNILSFMRTWLSVQPASVPVYAGHDRSSGERVHDEDVLGLSAANACVRLIAGTYASLPVSITRGGDDDIRIPAKDHWAYGLLHDSPNETDTAYDFFEIGGASLELKGNMLAFKDRSTGDRITSLLPMRWDETRVYRREDGRAGYEWRGEKLTSDEVLHVRGFGGDDLGGLSTISVASAAFGLAKATNRAAASTFRNGIRSQVVLGAERDLTEDQMLEARQRVEERYAGSMNSGRPLILNAGWKATPLAINPEDAQLLESRGFSVEEVCRFFGVPPVLVGHSGRKTCLQFPGATCPGCKYRMRRSPTCRQPTTPRS